MKINAIMNEAGAETAFSPEGRGRGKKDNRETEKNKGTSPADPAGTDRQKPTAE